MSVLNQVIEDHLHHLQLHPARLNVTPVITAGWSFLLAPEIAAELYLYSHDAQNIQLLMITPVDLPAHVECDIFAATVAPFITPLSLSNTQDQMALRLLIASNKKRLPCALSESIILTRRVAGIIFTNAYALCQNKKTFNESIQTTIRQLQQTRMT